MDIIQEVVLELGWVFVRGLARKEAGGNSTITRGRALIKGQCSSGGKDNKEKGWVCAGGHR